MTKATREFQVFVKPVGALCNLGCQYCYYLKTAGLYKPGGLAVMSDEMLERYIISHLDASPGDTVFFSWHGGEPTLAGIDFFRKAISLQKRHNRTGLNILNGIQTNATLLDDEWCSFFAENRFYTGVSIDGPEDLHNRFRLSKSGRPSFRDTMNGYLLLRKYNVATELLTVVNSLNVKHPLEVYRFLKDLGSPFLTFLPLVERVGGTGQRVSDNSVPPDEFGNFLTTIFDEWIEKDIGNIKVQIIEEATLTAFSQDHTLCIFKKTCGAVPVVELNGDFYSCDHYVNGEHLAGNISGTSLAELLESKAQRAFGNAKYDTLPRYCLECEVLEMCNGECPKNRFIKTPEGDSGLNYLCSGYRQFFNHIKPFVDAVSDQWKGSG